MVDPASLLVVADTNSTAQPVDKGTPPPDDMGYRAFVRAFGLRALVDLHPPRRDVLLFPPQALHGKSN